MRRLPVLAFSALILFAGVASATEITGGVSINLVGLTVPAGTLATTTLIHFTSVTAGPGLIYFSPVGLPQITLPNPTSKSLDPRLGSDSHLDLTFAGLGNFSETDVTYSVAFGHFLNITMLGNFFPTIAGDTETPFELDLSFTKSGPVYSGSGTLYSLYVPAPEPSSLVFLGTGLLGVAFAARRKFTR